MLLCFQNQFELRTGCTEKSSFSFDGLCAVFFYGYMFVRRHAAGFPIDPIIQEVSDDEHRCS